MYKYLFFIFIFCFTANVFADETVDKTEKIIQTLETNIDKKWINYSQKVFDILEKYRIKYKDIPEKISIINNIEYRLIKDQKLKPFKYGIANYYTPIFYTYNIRNIFGGNNGKTLKLDDYNQIDEVESIAFSWAIFEIYGEIKDWENTVYKIYTRDYDYLTKTGYYIDSRFVKIVDAKPENTDKTLPSAQTILERVKTLKWSQYVRWWNAPYGIPQILDFYPPNWNIDENLKNKWILSWVDCSGLLYYATDGYTPRNTSSLITYWTGVEIQWLAIDEIISKLKPLDIIVWRGHMILVIDQDTVIESVYERKFDETNIQSWVIINNSKEILKQILEQKTPVNDYNDPVFTDIPKFVIRRWYNI